MIWRRLSSAVLVLIVMAALPPSQRAAAESSQDSSGYVLLPDSDGSWKYVNSYVEKIPQADYRQAPESSREMFRDLKFGVRIHWGFTRYW